MVATTTRTSVSLVTCLLIRNSEAPLKKMLFSVAVALITACSASDPAVSPRPELVSAPYQADSGSVLIRCGVLIDGRSNDVLNDVSVLIEQGRFSAIGTQIETPPGIEVLDLAEYTCLPGLIEMHAHLLESFEELRVTLSANGSKSVRKSFSWDIVGGQFENLYFSLSKSAKSTL